MIIGRPRLIEAMGEAGKPPAMQEGQAAQQDFIRAWKVHAPGFTAAELAGLLDGAARYGKKVWADAPIQLFPDFDKKGLFRAAQAAEDEAGRWRNRFPFWGGPGTYYAKTAPEVEAVRKKILAVHQEVAGVKGGAAVVRAAREDLKKNLTDPDRWEWLKKAKPWLILGGILLGGAVVYPYAKPLLARIPSRANPRRRRRTRRISW